MPYVDKMFDLFNETYAKLASFVAISDAQKEYFKKKYIGFINPEYIKFVEDKDENILLFQLLCLVLLKHLKKQKENYFRLDFFIY